MSCCKCKEYHWEAPLPEAFPGDDGQEYCIFHAPADHPQKLIDAFNEAIETKILATKPEATCKLSGVVFPYALSFYDISAEKGLPGLDISGATFIDSVDFGHCIFTGRALFIGTVFNRESSFEATQFGFFDA